MKVAYLTLLVCLTGPVLALAQKKEVVELQRDVALLQDQVRSMQRSMDEKMAALTVLVQQSLDNLNKANTAIAVLDSSLRERMRDQEKTVAAPVAGLGAKVDTMAEEFRFVRESVTDVNARMSKLQAQLTDISNAIKVMQAPPAPPAPASGAPAGSPPPGLSAEQLYQSAMRDKLGGNPDLALQEFAQYIQYFGNTDLAPNAQYQMGEIYQSKGAFEDALKAFDMVLERYPENNKTPDAMYMKGATLLKMGQRTAAAQQFREVIKAFPGSEASTKSKAQLKSLGLSASTPATSRSTKRKRD